MEKYIGNCSCGDIEFCFDNDPINSIFCYCKACQALTGSDKWFGLWVPRDNFKFTKGTALSHTRVGDSGKEVNYYFCGTNQTALLEEVETKVFDILKTAAKCDQSKLSKKVSFEELGFDSLDSVELVVAME